ncbi:response regulator [Stutzerimonas kirkiae]|uniref:Response regulator n=1 Tax=Stutzerimonas kirkiae TaxID=2211392 RepID=A0A4Q9R6I8_9GAMM|nr:response regulator [Stutzerimonas kirkiae]TBU96005.1 response regulator [Stutzerimonas kirkiae]TBV03164.1 response regulator [Stutzerimonas kirkiae]TBV09753.1 response regulator [Stutzerimonas kirkiae]TBV13517.1 response regulator [Stutzerimonas kirkiae]
MSPPVLLICDDSSLARKQLLRALPLDWQVTVEQVDGGSAALERIRQGGVDLMLLDLTMPEMDGYQVLACLREEAHDCQVIVVSADIQEQAVRRVLSLGAKAFIRKPADPLQLLRTLADLGLLNALRQIGERGQGESIGFRDAFREVVNVAMGRAAALLAHVLGVFIQLPVPNVNILEVGELHMALADAACRDRLTAVCQGYIGGGIAGEALLIFHDSDIRDMARLMGSGDSYQDMEMLLDLSSLLISACLSGIAEQIDLVFSQGHPQVLGQHASIAELINVNRSRWRKTLAVELSYSIEGHDIHFDLLLLFTEDSVELLSRKIAYLVN